MAAPRVYSVTHGRPAYSQPSLGLSAFRDVVAAFGLFDGSACTPQISPRGVVSCTCHGCQQWKDFTSGRLSWPATWQAATGAGDEGRKESGQQQEEPDSEQQRGACAVAVKAAVGVGEGGQRGAPSMAARVHYEVVTQEMLLALAAYIRSDAHQSCNPSHSFPFWVFMGMRLPRKVVNGNDEERGTGGEWVRLEGLWMRVIATDAIPRSLPGAAAARLGSGASRENNGSLREGRARVEAGDEVIACDAEAAIAEYKPHIVIACWMVRHAACR
ncbi:unnamed protein product [Closterium sp. Yama58-4]|nr:unnamed protein product [Closterium sp. Yama58-4]